MIKTILAILFSTSILFAQDVKVGSYLPFEYCKNQFDQSIIVDKKTKMLIISFNQEQDQIVNEFLEKHKKFLKKHKAYYLRDVSTIPTFVLSMFIKPKLKSYDYEIGLVCDEKQALQIPKKEGKITIIYIRKKKIRRILFKDNLNFLAK